MKFGVKTEFKHDFIFRRNVFRPVIANMATVCSHKFNVPVYKTFFLTEVIIVTVITVICEINYQRLKIINYPLG